MSKTGKMQQWLNYKIRVTVQDRRDIIGQFMAFDKHMNLIIADAEEYRRVGGKGKGKEEKIQKRTLGLLLLRGENIVSLSIEGPPPPEENRNRQAPNIPVGPGVGRAAGRGVALPPVPGMMPPGLAAAPKGLGGPAPGAMQPQGRPPMGMPPGAPYGGPPPGMMPPGFPPKMPPGMPPPGMMPPGMPPKMGMPPGMPPPGYPGMPPPGYPGMPPPGMMPPGMMPPGMPPGMPPKMPPGMMPPGFPPGGRPPGQ
eukprot:TRINITY_DN3326_c0_g1_i1.p1 TRINITY_DN3326_c0_g1~~TRINITY_DN3326_c0_g1_i1.p1  ORF type:complete len:253 (-),score=60.25 TRINITY_DN3326_c0_g1_i1:467-1225(-)